MSRQRLSVEMLENRAVPASLPVVPEIGRGVGEHIREVYSRGLALGNRPDVFLKVGDSITADPQAMATLSSATALSTAATYHPELVDTIQTYSAGSGRDSFKTIDASARTGFRSDQAADFLPSAIAVTRPSVALIQVGTNDAPVGPAFVETHLRHIIQYCESVGVVAILTTVPVSTNPVHLSSPASFPIGINDTIARLADEYQLPLWNLHDALINVPAFGLRDGIHLTASPSGGGDLGPVATALYGNNIRNLTGLQVLDRVRDVLNDRGYDQLPPDSPWQPLQSGTEYVAVAADDSHRVVVTNTSGDAILSFNSFSISGDAAVGDVSGDGVPDVVIAAGRGAPPVVRALDGRDGAVLWQFFAYEPSFTGGVNIDVGDFDGDAFSDIVTGSGLGGGPLTRVFRGVDQTGIGSFFAFESSFRGGVRVSAADRDGDGIDEVVTGAGFGGAPVVKVFAPTGANVEAFFAYESSLRSGVFVDGGDVDSDGRDEILTGPGSDGPRVQAFAGGEQVRNFFAGDGASGARLTLVWNGGNAQLWASVGEGTRLKRWLLSDASPLADLEVPIGDADRLRV